MRFSSGQRARGPIDDKTMVGLLAAFTGEDVQALIRAQIDRAMTAYGKAEAELGKLGATTLGELAEMQTQVGRVRHRRIRDEDDAVVLADRLRRQMAGYRRAVDGLEVFAAHLEASRTYLLSEGEVRELLESPGEDDE